MMYYSFNKFIIINPYSLQFIRIINITFCQWVYLHFSK